MNPVLISLLLFLVSCASVPRKTPMVEFDKSKIRSYDFSSEKLKHLESPYYAKFSWNEKTLVYVAAEHISVEKAPNLLEHPTMKTINSLVVKFRPDVIIVEGVNTGQELSPKSVLAACDHCEQVAYRGCGESEYAMNQARAIGAQYISGEPEGAQIRKETLAKGYSEEDLLGLYMIRKIPQFKRSGENARMDEKLFSPWLAKYQRTLGTNTQFGYKEFVAWYNAHSGPNRTRFEDLSSDDSAPHGSSGASYFQKISNAVNSIRDRNVVATIESLQNQYDRVLVIYGGSHLISQEPALISGMGTPTYEKAF